MISLRLLEEERSISRLALIKAYMFFQTIKFFLHRFITFVFDKSFLVVAKFQIN